MVEQETLENRVPPMITRTYPKVEYKEKPLYEIFKRVFDVLCSAFALIVLSPLFLAVSLAIITDDFGNPIYTQMRTGKNGKEFKMFKFRSMYKDAEQRRSELLDKNEADGPIFKINEDPRVTKVGKFIRERSLDELPQLVNIIKRDMSIIGPRPLPTYEQAACNEYQQQRLLVKPGLSCYTALDKHSEDNFDRHKRSSLRRKNYVWNSRLYGFKASRTDID